MNRISRTILSTVLLGVLVLASPGTQKASAMGWNDNFADAQAIYPDISPVYLSINMTEATIEPDEPNPTDGMYPIAKTIWFSFQMNQPGVLEVYSMHCCYPTYVAIYTGNALSELSLVSWSGGGLYSGTSARLEPDQYYIQMGFIDDVPEWLDVSFTYYPKPSNDEFSNAIEITSLPFTSQIQLMAATRDLEEPNGSCCEMPISTVWYKFTPLSTSYIEFNFAAWEQQITVYTGSSYADLLEVGCQADQSQGPLILTLQKDKTYYIQLGSQDNYGTLQFSAELVPMPQVGFYYSPGDPTIFDQVLFQDTSYDPAYIGFDGNNLTWDFGDGTTAAGYSVSHKYANDGDYTVTHQATTYDGRSASTSQVISVHTHDVAITRFTVPTSANAGQTRSITVYLNSKRSVEKVRVDLYKSTPNGDELIGSLIQEVPIRPANRTTMFAFSYTFTKQDATIGKVTFRAVATLLDARDALPADNEVISFPVKVGR